MTSRKQFVHALEHNSNALQEALREARVLHRALKEARSSGDALQYNEYLRQLRSILKHHPTAWKLTGDLSARAAKKLIGFVAHDDVHVKESMMAGLRSVRDSLEYASSTTLERLMIDQIALVWLSGEVTRSIYTELAFRGGPEPEHGTYWEKRMASLEKRLQSSIESLARVRKMVRSTKAIQATYVAEQPLHPPAPDHVDFTDSELPCHRPPLDDCANHVQEEGEEEELDWREEFLKRAEELNMSEESIEMYFSLFDDPEQPSE